MSAPAIPFPEISSSSGIGTSMSGGGAAADLVTAQVQNTLNALSSEQLGRIFSLATELREEDGAYLEAGVASPQERRAAGSIDLMPLVIGGEEWASIERGISQRVRAWNLFLRDVYSGQEILKDGVVPYEIVYSDPNFHRGCARLSHDLARHLQFSAFDLQQDARGAWLVADSHLGVAEGASYALKQRQILRQLVPRLFEGLEILPIEDFATQILEVMQVLARTPDGGARGVLLSKGATDDHYLDHAALARQMGVPIVQGSDLIVLESRLYLKTIGGMERVDVLLRRLSTALLDPVTFDPDSRFGVPGFLSCVRKGTLAVANGLGSDLADNRALAAHLSSLIEYYTGEKPLLGSPQVLEMRDLDVREEVADNRDIYVIRHAWKRSAGSEWIARHMSGHDWHRLWQQIELAPSEYVVQKLPSQNSHPCWTSGGSRLAPITMRVFALGEDRISPCSLAWSGTAPLSAPTIQTTDRIKDVWILRSTQNATVSVHAQAEEAPKRLRLTSRVAESLFWMGRYAERAEATTRILRVVQGQAWPTRADAISRQRQPLWAAMAAVTGHAPDFFSLQAGGLVKGATLPFYLLLDREHSGSVISYLRSCRRNAESIREHCPPEVWSVLNGLYLQMALFSDQSATDRVRSALDDRSFHHELLSQFDELTGALDKHMLHNDAWHFWQLGLYAERSLITLLTVKHGLAALAAGVEPGAIPGSNLDLLLQMLAGQYAYRSLYHARPVAARVARLLLQDEEFSRSVLFCLHGMRRALMATFGDRPSRGADVPVRQCGRLITELNFIDMATYFPRGSGTTGQVDDADLADIPTHELKGKITQMIDMLLDFNVLISDHYLDHQVVFRDPELFDLSSVPR